MSAVRERVRTFVGWMAGAAAGRFLARRALTIAPEERLAWLNAHPDGLSFHTLDALLDIAREHVDDEPGVSIAVTEVVLRAIYRDAGVAFGAPFREHIHGRAWLEHANALRPAGDLLASRRAYHVAATIFAREGTGELEVAAAMSAEALVLDQLGDSDAARRTMHLAIAVCAAHADVAGLAQCHWYEGTIAFEKDRFEAAAAEFEKAFLLATRLRDEPMIARLRLSLGRCAWARGDRAAAIRDFSYALEYFARAGMWIDRQRVTWAMAQMAGDDGLVERAIDALDGVARELESAGFVIDAALARRDIVEVLVVANHHSVAAEIARSVFETLAGAGLFREALWTAVLLQQAESDRALGRDQS